jgi:hypothetical protein
MKRISPPRMKIAAANESKQLAAYLQSRPDPNAPDLLQWSVPTACWMASSAARPGIPEMVNAIRNILHTWTGASCSHAGIAANATAATQQKLLPSIDRVGFLFPTRTIRNANYDLILILVPDVNRIAAPTSETTTERFPVSRTLLQKPLEPFFGSFI